MGGKSRKSGGVSKRLLEQIKSGTLETRIKTDGKNVEATVKFKGIWSSTSGEQKS